MDQLLKFLGLGTAKNIVPLFDIKVDVHSHLLPGIDDGAKSLDESIASIEALHKLGYMHLITTPHIHWQFYKNTKDIILEKLDLVKAGLLEKQVPVSIDAAAEYYLDEHFIKLLEESPEELMTFGNNYLLFEMSFLNMPLFLEQTISRIQSLGFKPVLAHPERYEYFQRSKSLVNKFLDLGLFMQVNIGALGNAYGKHARVLGEKLILEENVLFAGTDYHHISQLKFIKKGIGNKHFQQAMVKGLQNNFLKE